MKECMAFGTLTQIQACAFASAFDISPRLSETALDNAGAELQSTKADEDAIVEILGFENELGILKARCFEFGALQSDNNFSEWQPMAESLTKVGDAAPIPPSLGRKQTFMAKVITHHFPLCFNSCSRCS